MLMTNALICAGPSGGVACHGAAAARIFAIYENFSGKSVSVLLVYNSLFFINHIRKRYDMKVPEKDVFEHFHVGPCI
ncbi:hypothetical protein CYQ92_02420 [Escherichia coli]|nr:hypothetical protein CYQ92_02420 [Escherichia coli]